MPFHFLLPIRDMAPFYEECCRDLGWQLDTGMLERMKKENEEELRKMNEAIEEAETSMGETEIREANLKKAEYLSRIGDKVGWEFWSGGGWICSGRVKRYFIYVFLIILL